MDLNSPPVTAPRPALRHDPFMKDWIRRLSFQSEFTIVVLGAFGFTLVTTVLVLAAPDLVLILAHALVDFLGLSLA